MIFEAIVEQLQGMRPYCEGACTCPIDTSYSTKSVVAACLFNLWPGVRSKVLFTLNCLSAIPAQKFTLEVEFSCLPIFPVDEGSHGVSLPYLLLYQGCNCYYWVCGYAYMYTFMLNSSWITEVELRVICLPIGLHNVTLVWDEPRVQASGCSQLTFWLGDSETRHEASRELALPAVWLPWLQLVWNCS